MKLIKDFMQKVGVHNLHPHLFVPLIMSHQILLIFPRYISSEYGVCLFYL